MQKHVNLGDVQKRCKKTKIGFDTTEREPSKNVFLYLPIPRFLNTNLKYTDPYLQARNRCTFQRGPRGELCIVQRATVLHANGSLFQVIRYNLQSKPYQRLHSCLNLISQLCCEIRMEVRFSCSLLPGGETSVPSSGSSSFREDLDPKRTCEIEEVLEQLPNLSKLRAPAANNGHIAAGPTVGGPGTIAHPNF